LTQDTICATLGKEEGATLMTGPWDTKVGCHIGIITNGKIYSMGFAGHGRGVQGSNHGRGTACYTFEVHEALTEQQINLEHIPSERVLSNLARKYLGSSYSDFWKAERKKPDRNFLFYINSGLSQEKLSAFLAAAVIKGLK
jgi:hypothetical protein